MAQTLCKHCGKALVHGAMPFSRAVWFSRDKVLENMNLAQYCWIDPVLGSQLHEPVEPDLNSEITKIWEKYDPATFNQQSVAIAFAKEVRAIKV